MKSLGDFKGSTECSQIRALLASRGIPTKLGTSVGIDPSPLYVCIDAQYEDALAVLANPDHVVANPVDVAKFYKEMQSRGLDTMMAGSGKLLALLLVLIGIAVVVHYYL